MIEPQRTLITGGAGFIGSNLANQLLSEGHNLTIFDNLSRPGCKHNLAWLRQTHGESSFRFVQSDLTDFENLCQAAEGAQRIYHLAGQVAVTSSVKRPREDFEANALGTFNALEAARLAGDSPVFLYASTNKVYGAMEEVRIIAEKTRYSYADFPCGIPENQTIDFHSPYGCSKGAGEQYTRDYSRIYGLRTVAVRQSCIYGYRQFGIEDQGWLAWFIIAALKDRPITIYGDGKQVRDVLFIDDLLTFYEAAIRNINVANGQIYNVGGGPGNTLSIWIEYGPLLEELIGRPIPVTYSEWRPGDQPVYISDIRKAANQLDWQPRVSVRVGVTRLYNWIHDHQDYFNHI